MNIEHCPYIHCKQYANSQESNSKNLNTFLFGIPFGLKLNAPCDAFYAFPHSQTISFLIKETKYMHYGVVVSHVVFLKNFVDFSVPAKCNRIRTVWNYYQTNQSTHYVHGSCFTHYSFNASIYYPFFIFSIVAFAWFNYSEKEPNAYWQLWIATGRVFG